MSEKSLALIGPIDWNDEMTALAKQTVCKGASDAEFKLFIEQCKATKLNPFARQIYSIRRKQWNGDTRSYDEAQVTQVSIDGFRLIADRTQKYAGQVGPWWCGADGEWKEVWLADAAPAAAKVGVLRHDFHQPIYSIALYKSYVSTNKSGEPVSRWKSDPAGMIAKCAESLALRRAFPQELSGLYTTEEMAQADNDAVTVEWKATDPHAPIHPPVEVRQNAQPTNGNGKQEVPSGRPYSPDDLRKNFSRAVVAIETRGLQLGPDDYHVTEKATTNLIENPADLAKYLEFVTGVPFMEDMSEGQVIALLRILKPVAVAETWLPCDEAMKEAEQVLKMMAKQPPASKQPYSPRAVINGQPMVETVVGYIPQADFDEHAATIANEADQSKQPTEPSPFDEPMAPANGMDSHHTAAQAEPTWDEAALLDIEAQYGLVRARLMNTLKYCGLPKDTDKLREWMSAYKGYRDQKMTPQEAGPKADIAVVAQPKP
jgi:phage recombination protein Bet